MKIHPLVMLVIPAPTLILTIPMTSKFDLISLLVSSKAKLSRVVARIVPSADVEDILQETYLRVSASAMNQDVHEPLAFVTQIAKNLALDHIKSAEFKKLRFADSETIEGIINQDNFTDQTFSEVSSKQDLLEFLSAVKNLPPKCQEIYTLKKIYGYSQKEIADRLGISASNVEKHIAYGTKKLFHLMPQDQKKSNLSGKAKALNNSAGER
jgi:RNA polymerase sigma factor (sigma-70 family)